MSNPANIGIKVNDKDTLYLYQNWAPDHMLGVYAKALEAAWPRIQMTDWPYAARIITSSIIGPHWASETGFGFTINEIAENAHTLVIVDLPAGLVHLYESDGGRKIVSFGIEKFINKYSRTW